jgi:hypothetical protein
MFEQQRWSGPPLSCDHVSDIRGRIRGFAIDEVSDSRVKGTGPGDIRRGDSGSP